MADVKMPEFIPCKFDEKGWSPCKKPSNNGWCSEHEHLKCVSCGKKAVLSCDHQMGGLACGSPLCETCEHGEDGNHVTKIVADQKRQQKKDRENAKIIARTSPDRWMNEELGVPATLFELLKGDWLEEGYKFVQVYFLALNPSLMGFFPAVFSSDNKRIVVTTDLCLLQKVWKTLEPRQAKIFRDFAYVNFEIGIGYMEPERPEKREDREPFKILTTAEFKRFENTQDSFQWAWGLLGGEISQENFIRQLIVQAIVFDSTFNVVQAV